MSFVFFNVLCLLSFLYRIFGTENIKRLCMSHKSFVLFIALFLSFASGLSAQKKVSVLGDSYSTYGGYVTPATNLCWYNGVDGGKNKQNDVKGVEQMWWHHFIREHGYRLECNNSYSGSTVCLTGYRKEDFSDRAFITRLLNLGHPDIIFVFGGTNDSWAAVPIGEYKYAGWTKSELYSFRPAFCYLLASLKELYPDACIYNITNSGLSDVITSSMDEICRHYGVTNIRLKNIDKQLGHPSVEGMKSISKQLWQAIAPEK